MVELKDIDALTRFFRREPIRYRHILRDLGERPSDQIWHERGDLSALRRGASTYYVDSWDEPAMVIRIERTNEGALPHCQLRAEGEFGSITEGELAHWCEHLAPRCVVTTHRPIRDCLGRQLGARGWSEQFHLTCPPEGNLAPARHRVLRLDRDQAIARVLGVAVDGRTRAQGVPSGAIIEGFAIPDDAGPRAMVAVHEMTTSCDEVAVHAEVGAADPSNLPSLVSAASDRILARGRLPAIAVSAGKDAAWLLAIGFRIAATSWAWHKACRGGDIS